MSKPSRRVLLLVENLPISRDHRLRKQAAALVESGFSVTVVCRKDPDNHKVDGVVLREYASPPEGDGKLAYLYEYFWSLLMASWCILSCLFAEGFDVIQVASTPDIYFLITLPLRAFGKAVVFDARDLSPEIYARRYGRKGGAVLRVLRALEWVSYRTAKEVIAVNTSVAQVAVKRCGVPAERVIIVGNGPALRDLTVTSSSERGERLLCCWIGLIGPQDGVDLALRAIAQLVHERGLVDTTYVFAGAGDALKSLRELAAALDLEKWVSFPGWADQDEVAEILRSADIGLEPNLEDFVSPVKVMEYMAYGLPVVAFELLETTKILGGGGLYASPGDISGFADCIEALLADPAARRRLGATGQQRVRTRFAWELQAVRYNELFENLLATDRPLARTDLERPRV